MTGLLIAGTTSDAGKSLVVTGLCRALRRRGVDVAPFKAQNMSNNSMVCADGSEIGRAQWLQAVAAGLEPESAMNPVLLKPGTDRRSFVVLRGKPAGRLEAGEYATGRRHLAEAAWAAYEELAARHDLIVCEGAGSPAEINLREGDYTNLGLARRFDLPVVLVGDIDRGGLLASLFGHWAILSDEADRDLLAGFIVNKFRGDVEVLRPGLAEITTRTGMRDFGVLPWLEDVWLDGEDALTLGAWRRAGSRQDGAPAYGQEETLRVAVVAFPRTSNATDVDALAQEPGVDVVVTRDPELVRAADIAVLPGSRSTIDDLRWLRESGLADVVVERAREGLPVFAVCGGYQMLARSIDDEDGIEAGASRPGGPADAQGSRGRVVEGLGLLPVEVSFAAEKILGRPRGQWRGHEVVGYEIHHGVCTVDASASASAAAAVSAAVSTREPSQAGEDERAEAFLDGVRVGQVWGTLWHGAMENDGFRRAWLTQAARASGSGWRPWAEAPGFGARREAMIETLAAAMEAHVDLDSLLALAR